MRVVLLAALAAQALGADVAQTFVNQKVTRRIDASRHVVSASTSFKAAAKGAASAYYLAFTEAEAAHLADLVVEAEEGTTKYSVRRDDSITKPGFVHYAVELPSPLKADDSIALKVTALYTDVQKPLPAEITQYERQFVKLDMNAYATSPYASEKSTTTVKLASAKVESFSREPAPANVEGSKYKLGAYSAVEAYAVAPVAVHYENNGAPFATAQSVLREIEVSLWGNVAVEEHYDLKHTGAALKGGFSRIDYQSPARPARSASFAGLSASLPREVSDIYYRDIIGNVTTSHVRTTKSATELELDFRFPLFGGWKTQWYQGYNVPAGKYLSVVPGSGASTYTLSYDAHIPYAEVPIRDYEVKVVLPEGAVVGEVTAPFPHSVTHSRRFTYLDGPFLGRPVVVIKAEGTVVSRVADPGAITVSFSVPSGSLWYKLGYVSIAFFFMFLLSSLAASVANFLKLDAAGKAAAAKAKTQ